MNATAWVIAIIAFAVGIADFVLLDYFGPTGTISYVFLTAARRYPIIPFCLGLLAGHLFWPQNGH